MFMLKQSEKEKVYIKVKEQSSLVVIHLADGLNVTLKLLKHWYTTKVSLVNILITAHLNPYTEQPKTFPNK